MFVYFFKVEGNNFFKFGLCIVVGKIGNFSESFVFFGDNMGLLIFNYL